MAQMPKNLNIILILEANAMRNFLLTIMLASVSLPVIYAGYYNMALNGLRGEMRVMLSQILTLERVVSADSGEYAFFEEFYGAPIQGKSNCKQPQGAAKLGFKIDWCHEKGQQWCGMPIKFLNQKVKMGSLLLPNQEVTILIGASFAHQTGKWINGTWMKKGSLVQ